MAENAVPRPLHAQAHTLTEDGVPSNAFHTETVMLQHAPFSELPSMQRVAEMHPNSTYTGEEEQTSSTEHLFSSPHSSCKGEDYWSNAESFSTLKNAEEYPLKDNVSVHLSDSECSDVDLDNGWVQSEDLDSDSSIASIENKKQSKWLCPFFEMLENIRIDPTTDIETQGTLFYCPACRGSGLGEVSVYKGFKPLIAHAKQYKKRRVKLHRDFAAVLEEDLKRRGIIIAEPCRVNPFSKWMSLMEDEKWMSPLIVWPPMLVIQTAGVEVDGHHKRVGLRNREFLEMFKGYHPRKAIQAYVDDSLLNLLVFRDSPVGYMHAKCLAKNFKSSKRGRRDWDDLRMLKLQHCSDGMLYGYMAREEDMLMLTSDPRKKKVKWDLKTYQDVIIEPLIQMHEAKLENNWLKAKLQEQEGHNKVLEKVLSKLFAKLELEEEEVEFASQIATKHFEATMKYMNEPLQMETSCDGDGDTW